MTFKQTIKRITPWYFVLLFTCLVSSQLMAKTNINIAVASNFHYTLSELLKDYPDKDKLQIKLSSGSSGMLFAQIKQGAPFDLFFSADTLRPKLLEQAQLTSFRQTYALGQLALWSNTPITATADPDSTILSTTATNQELNNQSQRQHAYIQALQTNKNRIAYANPKLAPFGLAAEQVLSSLKQQPKNTILGNNVNQVFQFVDTNNVNLGFVPLSLLLQAKQRFKHKKYDNYWLVPNQQYQSIKQQVVILKRTKQTLAVKALVNYILSAPIQKKLVTMGYQSANTLTAGQL